eukprot:IDg23173t1
MALSILYVFIKCHSVRYSLRLHPPSVVVSATTSLDLPVVMTSRSTTTKSSNMSAEWAFFSDAGKWDDKSFYLKAECKECAFECQSRRESMHRHIKKCHLISNDQRAAYFASGLAVKIQTHHRRSVEGKSKSIGNFFGPTLSSSRLKIIQDQAVRFSISANVSFKALEDPEFRKLLELVNPTAKLPTAVTLRTTVLDRLKLKEKHDKDALYRNGAHITLSFDGWKTPTNDSWLGFCRLLRDVTTGILSLDLSRFEDVSLTGETEVVIRENIEKEIGMTKEKIEEQGGRLIGVISDS